MKYFSVGIIKKYFLKTLYDYVHMAWWTWVCQDTLLLHVTTVRFWVWSNLAQVGTEVPSPRHCIATVKELANS